MTAVSFSSVLFCNEFQSNIFTRYVVIAFSGGPSLRRAMTPVSEMKPIEVRNRLAEVPIERDRITLAEILMEGVWVKHGLRVCLYQFLRHWDGYCLFILYSH